jgi:hypothetical protein
VAILLEFLLQLLLEVFGEVLLELGIGVFKSVFERQNREPVIAAVGYLLLGAVLGALSLWILPERLLRPAQIPGLSLVIAPLAGGVAMHLWGKYRRSHGHSTTNLATFHCGAALLFSYALVRFLWAN